MNKISAVTLVALSTMWVLCANSVLAQESDRVQNINKWFQDLDKRYPNLRKKYETGPLQNTGKIQTPGNIQVPTGIKAIKTTTLPCSQRFLIGSDCLFEFDKATLNPRAEETLRVLAPMIQELGPHPIKIEGHTDSIGTDEYNQQLSERRAERVKNWLLENRVMAREAAEIEGFGERKPVAPNTKPDKSDNPAGRALNRRVEIVVNTCKTVEEAVKEKAYAAQKQREAAAAAAAASVTSSSTDQTSGAAQSTNAAPQPTDAAPAAEKPTTDGGSASLSPQTETAQGTQPSRDKEAEGNQK